MAEKLEFDLSVKDNLSSALDKATNKAFSLESALETALGVFTGSLATKAFDTVISGFNSLITTGKEAIDAAAAQEVAVNNLNNALARSGNFSKQASADILEFAASMQRLTVFEDDAVISNTALLQSLTKLNADGLKQGVQAAADFATVLGVDLETATRLVAKGAEGNTEAFKRYGVEVKKGSSDTETFANLIQQLNSQFGGAAAAQLNTYSGALKATKNSYNDLLEPIGDIIVKNPLVIAGLNLLKDGFNFLNDQITPLIPTIQQYLNAALLTTIDVAKFLLDGLDGLTIIFKGLINTVQIFGGVITTSLIAPVKDAIDGLIFLAQNIPGLGDKFDGLKNPLDGLTKSLQDFTNNGVKGLTEAADGNIFRTLSDGADSLQLKLKEKSAAVIAANSSENLSNQTRVQSENDTNAEILKAREQLGIEILGLQANLAAEQQAFNEQLIATGAATELEQNQLKLDAIYNQKIAEAQAVYEGELLKNKAITDADQLKLANEKAFQALSLASVKAANQKELEQKRLLSAEEKRLAAERVANQRDTYATIATLSTSGNRTLAAIGKAAALTQIAIDTPVAIGKALAAFPPPFNFAAAGAVGAAMAAQAARVVGVQFENGGVVGQGASAGPDNRVASIRDGEMILNASQQEKLFNMINNGPGGGNIQVIIDGREVAVAVRNQIQQGFRLA